MRPTISALEIRKRLFPKRFRGFDPAEVTQFLEALAEDLEEMARELDELERENARLKEENTRHRDTEVTLKETLLLAQRSADSLREAIAEMQCVPVEAVQIVTGASEALVALMWLAAEPGANVIIPLPGFTTFSALPESLGLETRFYRVRRENGFRIDPDEIKRLADQF